MSDMHQDEKNVAGAIVEVLGDCPGGMNIVEMVRPVKAKFPPYERFKQTRYVVFLIRSILHDLVLKNLVVPGPNVSWRLTLSGVKMSNRLFQNEIEGIFDSRWFTPEVLSGIQELGILRDALIDAGASEEVISRCGHRMAAWLIGKKET
jgi:hypothetical protein